MNSVIEVIVVIAVVAAALAFVVVKAVRAFSGRRPSCCSGEAGCPHCRERDKTY
jgi:hypothetical protein